MLQKPLLTKSTGKAVLVSGLTAIVGFGSLILAKHQGIRSLGIIMSFGIAACMVAALAVLPAFLSVLKHRKRKNEPTSEMVRERDLKERSEKGPPRA